MSDHAHPHPDVGLYVLDGLEPADKADFEALLRGCEVCRAEVADLEGLPALLELAPAPATPPPELRERTRAAVERAAAERAAEEQAAVARAAAQSRRRRRWARTLAAAAVLVAVAVIGFTLGSAGVIGGRSQTIEVALAAADGGPARATANIRTVDGHLEVAMEATGLTPTAPGTTYECWFVGAGDTLARPNRISAGTFTVGPNGRASVRLTSAADLTRFPIMGVTLERDAGDPKRSGEKVLVSQPIS
jgi:hypothetical protein